jgi:hypothetical protein
MLAKKAQTGLRNLQTVGMDEVTAAVWKATTDDLFEAKEKHVAAIARWAGEPGSRAPLAAALAKRVQSCGARPVTTAKTLYLLHQLALVGAEEVLRQPLRELASLVGRGALPGPMLDYASYVTSLCAWEDASVFRNEDAPSFWRCMHLSQLLSGLPSLQRVLDSALCLALETRDVDSAAQASLHLAVAEDALGLFQCEVAAAAGLWDGLLALTPKLADGAIAALQAAGRHAADALMLQRSLGSWMGGSGALASPARLPGLIEKQMPWSGHRAQAAAAAAAAAGAAAAAVATVRAPAPPAALPSPPVSFPAAASPSPAPRRSAPASEAGAVTPPSPSAFPCAVRPLVSSPSLTANLSPAAGAPNGEDTGGEASAGVCAQGEGAASPPFGSRSAVAVAVPALRTEELEIPCSLPPPRPLCLSPSTREGSSACAEWNAAGILPPAPVSPSPLLPPLPVEMSTAQLRLAAYEALLLSSSHSRERPAKEQAGSRGGVGSRGAAGGGGRGVRTVGRAVEDLAAGEEELATVRTRLGITLRTHRRLRTLLNLDATNPPVAGHTCGSIAHRASLLLQARPSGGAPPADILSFGERQALLIANAVVAAGASTADARRLCQHATAFIEARCANGEHTPADAGNPFAQPSRDPSPAPTNHAAAPDTTNPFLDPVFIALSEARPAGPAGGGQGEREAERALQQALADLGVFPPSGVKVGSSDGEAALVWPPGLAARLYCCLLGACFESAESGSDGFVTIASDAPAVRAALRCTWACALPLDASAEALCALIVAFDRYAEAGGAGLVLVRRALDEAIPGGRAALEAAGGMAGGGHAVCSSPAVPAPCHGVASAPSAAAWAEESRPTVLAGVVSFLGGKLRDYRGHFAIDVSEMREAVGVWAEVRGAGRGGEGVGSGKGVQWPKGGGRRGCGESNRRTVGLKVMFTAWGGNARRAEAGWGGEDCRRAGGSCRAGTGGGQ